MVCVSAYRTKIANLDSLQVGGRRMYGEDQDIFNSHVDHKAEAEICRENACGNRGRTGSLTGEGDQMATPSEETDTYHS